MWSAVKRRCGQLLNVAGMPGFIRSKPCGLTLGGLVEVAVNDQYTVVTVQNVHLLFDRVSGHFDGVVLTSECETGAAHQETVLSG